MLLKSKIESLLRPVNQNRCKVTLIEDAFGIPPPLQIRRVVVTGIGLATPLGVGVKQAWHALLHGDCGIKRLQAEDLPKARLHTQERHPKGTFPRLLRMIAKAGNLIMSDPMV